MLQKLAKQSAIYGISTIIGRMLGYLLTPYYTRIFAPEEYGIITDLYALIPFALIIATMGLESSYFRFAAKAEEQSAGDPTRIEQTKNRLFASCWGTTSLFAILIFAVIWLFRDEAAVVMGEVYLRQPLFIPIVGAIVMLDVATTIPFARLREQSKAGRYVSIKLLNIVLQVALALLFGFMGLFATSFGVGWALVGNLIASGITFLVILMTTSGIMPRIDPKILKPLIIYSLPLLISGIAATATEFIDRQMIKHIIPLDAMAQLGIYGAVVKIAVVMTLFTQMYRLAAEPFFLSNFKKEEFLEMNAAAMKFFIIASMMIFLFIALFRDLFALIVGSEYREGLFILPVVLGANVLMGVWLNLSFWYKREERTWFAIIITMAGLIASVIFNLLLVPRWGYYGAAWARLLGEATIVGVSYYLNRRFFPTPYDLRAIFSYVAIAIALFALSEKFLHDSVDMPLMVGANLLLLTGYAHYAIRREKIDVRGLMLSALSKILRR